MVKKILVFLVLVLFLSGCVFDPVTNWIQENSTVLSDDTSNLIVWGLFEDEENIKPLIDQFELENPNIKIEYVKKDKNDYVSQLNTVLQDNNRNTTPDIFMIHNSWVGNYATYTTTAPSSVISYQDFKTELHDFVMEDFGKGETVRGVPLWVDMLGLVYHKNLLLETGSTSIASEWNLFLEQAKIMQKEHESRGMVYGFSAGRSNNVEFHPEILDLLFLQARDTDFSQADLEVPFKENEIDQINEAIVFYRSLGETTWSRDAKLDTASFVEGKLASMIIPSWRILDILYYNEQKQLGIDLGISGVPQLSSDSDARVNVASYWGYTVSKDSQKNTDSWEFLKFLMSKEGQEIYMQSQTANGRPFAMISPRKDQVASQKDDKYIGAYVESIDYVHSWYKINGDKLEVSYAELLDRTITLENFLERFNDLKQNDNIL